MSKESHESSTSRALLPRLPAGGAGHRYRFTALLASLVLLGPPVAGCRDRPNPETNETTGAPTPIEEAGDAAERSPRVPDNRGDDLRRRAGDAGPVAEPSAGVGATQGERAPVHLVRHRGNPAGSIGYIVVEPAEASDDVPLLIALHGRGDRPERFADLMETLRLPIRSVVARGPLRWGLREGRQWFDSGADDADAQVVARVEDLVRLLDELKRAHPEAPDPILLGFSQGAMLALQAVARRPERIRAVVALSGHLPVSEGNASAEEPVPMFLSAGSRDRLVPPEKIGATAETLRELGHDPEVFHFEGRHAVPREVRDRVRGFLRDVIEDDGAP